jgi:hypothetical protein
MTSRHRERHGDRSGILVGRVDPNHPHAAGSGALGGSGQLPEALASSDAVHSGDLLGTPSGRKAMTALAAPTADDGSPGAI